MCGVCMSVSVRVRVGVTVADARFMKPLDIDLVRKLASENDVLITIEENSVLGFGDYVLHFLALEGALDDGKLKCWGRGDYGALGYGADDTIVPPTCLLEAKEFLNIHGFKIKTKIFKDCEHKITTEASSLGLEFLKKNLL